MDEIPEKDEQAMQFIADQLRDMSLAFEQLFPDQPFVVSAWTRLEYENKQVYTESHTGIQHESDFADAVYSWSGLFHEPMRLIGDVPDRSGGSTFDPYGI